MVGTSKILTVSYGTFSCTLEGFDDPFSTMKSISEYFRDLAADDRYFGAEPPTPDAEMLHRIAEREIQRRVEARVQDNALVLRQLGEDEPDQQPAPVAAPKSAEAPTEAAPVAEAPAAAPQPEKPAFDAAAALAAVAAESAIGDAQDDQPANDVEQDDVEQADAEQEPASETAAAQDDAQPAAEVENAAAEPSLDDHAEDDSAGEDHAEDTAQQAPAAPAAAEVMSGDSIAAKLSRIRAVVSGDAPANGYSEDEHADDMFDAEAPLTSMFDDAEADEAIANVTGAMEADAANVDEDAQREALEAAFDAAGDEFDVPATSADVPEITDEDTPLDLAAFSAALEETPAAQDDNAEIEDTADIAEDTADSVAAEADARDNDDDGALSSLIGSLSVGNDDTAEDDSAEEDAPADVEIAEDAQPEVAAQADDQDTSDDADAPVANDTSARPDAVRRARARVIKMRRADVEDSVDAGSDLADDEVTDYDAEALEIMSDDEIDPEVAAAFADTSLSDADEQDLLANLAAASGDLEEETAEIDTANDAAPAGDAEAEAEDTSFADATAAAVASAAARAAADEAAEAAAQETSDVARARRDRDGRALLESAADEDGEAVSRLLAETDREFSKDDGSRRRRAIQHLKAAVRAKDDLDTGEDEKVENQYRDDLSRVVKPRRPEAGERRAERRLAPLMLVSEQRVDLPKTKPAPAAPVTPVRPRRVAAGGNLALRAEVDADLDDDTLELADADGNLFADAESFADYAESVGANALPDLLEAAAAYTAFVEKRPSFSRPQIMRAVQEMTEESYSREDGLRSFGQLLRQGKIQKLKRGQFTVAEDTRFKPPASIAGE